MSRVTIVREDVKSLHDGYHIDVWEGLCEAFGVNPDTTEFLDVEPVKASAFKEEEPEPNKLFGRSKVQLEGDVLVQVISLRDRNHSYIFEVHYRDSLYWFGLYGDLLELRTVTTQDPEVVLARARILYPNANFDVREYM